MNGRQAFQTPMDYIPHVLLRIIPYHVAAYAFGSYDGNVDLYLRASDLTPPDKCPAKEQHSIQVIPTIWHGSLLKIDS